MVHPPQQRPVRTGPSSIRLCLASALLWAATMGAVATPARAQFTGDWSGQIVSRVIDFQFNSPCFSELKRDRLVYILGLVSPDVRLSAQEESALINTLSDALRQRTRNRIAVARRFQDFAARSGGLGEALTREISRLEREANDADITVLMLPVRSDTRRLVLEVALWLKDGGDSARRVACAPTFNIEVKRDVRQDPRCARAWRMAVGSNSLDEYRAFTRFFSDCAEADEAAQRIAELELIAGQERCRSAFAAARAESTSAAYTRFLRDHGTCPEGAGLDLVIQTLRRLEQAGTGSGARDVAGAGRAEPGPNRSNPLSPAPSPSGTVADPARADAPARHLRRPSGGGETCTRRGGATFCASSFLPTAGVNTSNYSPSSLVDGTDRTAWVEGARGKTNYGIGEYIAIDFPRRQTVRGLRIKNGYPKSRRHFRINSRVRQALVSFSDGATETLRLRDVSAWQDLRFSRPREADWVRIEIVDVYPGSKYADTAINELRVY